MLVLVFVLLCTLFVFLILERYHQRANRLLRGILAFVFSQALLSFAYSLFLFTRIPYVLILGIFSLLFAGIIIYHRKSFRPVFKREQNARMPAVVLALLLLCLYAFTADFLKLSKVWGEWDAYAIWSLHAKFLMDSQTFRQLFSATLAWSHPDYPLMLPTWIAAYWHATGSINPEVPLFIAYLASMSILLISFLHFYQQQKIAFGLIVTLLLCANNILLPTVTFQYADTPLALFILMSFVLWEQWLSTDNKLLLVFLGFSVACCGWIKNEGLVFFLVFSSCLFFKLLSRKERLGYYLAGTLVPLLFILIFKFKFATANDLFQGGWDGILIRIKDTGRYELIWKYVSDFMTSRSNLLLYTLAASLLFIPRYFLSPPFLAMLGLFLAYLLIYVITPNDLEWHLASSFDRLLHHLAPALIFSVVSSFSKKYRLELRVQQD